METPVFFQCHRLKHSSQKLENIEEEAPMSTLPMTVQVKPPETPTETMEFLARSWSLSAVEISKALNKHEDKKDPLDSTSINAKFAFPVDSPAKACSGLKLQLPVSAESIGVSPPISPRINIDTKLTRGAGRGRSTVGWLKDQKEKRRAEARSQKAQAYAATSVAGVATAVAALVAGTVFLSEGSKTNSSSKVAAALASAAALVASHCVEMAQTMGASHEQILAVIHSAVKAQTSGDIMALTAGAATALRGAAALRARLYKQTNGAGQIAEDKASDGCSSALNFVLKGGELLKSTRKGILHRKQVSVYMNSNSQVVVKTKSTHMVGTFVKKKKCIVLDVCPNIPALPGREIEGSDQRAVFGIKTSGRIIEFECKSKSDKQTWVDGIRQMLDCRANMNIVYAHVK